MKKMFVAALCAVGLMGAGASVADAHLGDLATQQVRSYTVCTYDYGFGNCHYWDASPSGPHSRNLVYWHISPNRYTCYVGYVMDHNGNWTGVRNSLGCY